MHDADAVLLLAARLELASEHPLGRTIVEEARLRGHALDEHPTDVEVIKGGGIRGTVDGCTVAVGSRRVLAEKGVDLPDSAEAHAVERERGGNTAVFTVVDGEPAGVISIADPIRPEAKAAIAAMRRRGVKTFHMLTGDNRHTAARVGAGLGFDQVRAELLPADKVRIVQGLKDAGHRVAMVGDGINDAPAIATADVGLAMGAGTDVSIQTADVILMGNRLDQLVHAYSLSKATVGNMKQNTWIALGTVVLLLAGVLAQKVFMATGMLVHEISVLVVIINAVRLVRFKDKRAPAPTANAGQELEQERKTEQEPETIPDTQH